MQRYIRLGLGLIAALAFTPALAAYAVNDTGGDNSDTDLPPVAELQSPQPDDSKQASAPDQSDEYGTAGAASAEPDRDLTAERGEMRN